MTKQCSSSLVGLAQAGPTFSPDAALAAKRIELIDHLLAIRGDVLVEREVDPLDNAMAFAGRGRAVDEINRTRDLLRQVEAAIGRFNDGTYGTCEECEGDILEARLKAVPWAACCIPC